MAAPILYARTILKQHPLLGTLFCIAVCSVLVSILLLVLPVEGTLRKAAGGLFVLGSILLLVTMVGISSHDMSHVMKKGVPKDEETGIPTAEVFKEEK